MSLRKESSAGSAFPKAVWKERYAILIIIAVIAGLYLCEGRKLLVTSSCHIHAETLGRERMKMRAQQNPENTQIVQVANAGLYANEDYAPAYRNCMLRKGYEPELP